MKIDDIDLAAAISAAIHEGGAHSSIVVDVTAGVVTLEGAVDTDGQRSTAEALVRQFEGVAGVINAIVIER